VYSAANLPRKLGSCMSAASATYFHRSNADGTFDSICMTCYRTVDTQPGEAALAMKERVHVCNPEDFLIVLPGVTSAPLAH
jgi:hypothetical protein